MKSKWFHHISSTKYIFPLLIKMIALHQIVREHTDSAHTEVEDLSSSRTNGSDDYDMVVNTPLQSSSQVERIYRLNWCLKSV